MLINHHYNDILFHLENTLFYLNQQFHRANFPSISAGFSSLSFHVKPVVDSSSAKLTKKKPKLSHCTSSCKEKDEKDANVTLYPQAEILLQKYMA